MRGKIGKLFTGVFQAIDQFQREARRSGHRVDAVGDNPSRIHRAIACHAVEKHLTQAFGHLGRANVGQNLQEGGLGQLLTLGQKIGQFCLPLHPKHPLGDEAFLREIGADLGLRDQPASGRNQPALPRGHNRGRTCRRRGNVGGFGLWQRLPVLPARSAKAHGHQKHTRPDQNPQHQNATP